jgi:hypothetical protein
MSGSHLSARRRAEEMQRRVMTTYVATAHGGFVPTHQKFDSSGDFLTKWRAAEVQVKVSLATQLPSRGVRLPVGFAPLS